MSLKSAIAYAQIHHAGQKRKTGERYVEHSLRVLNILKRFDLEEEVLCAAVLHDVNEDTDSTDPAIAKEFGDRVAGMVNALSKNQKSPRQQSRSTTPPRSTNTRLGFYLLRLKREGEKEAGVIFIKMADQIDNLASLYVYSKEKQQRKIREIEEDFLPIYDRVTKHFTPILRKKFRRLRTILVKQIQSCRPQMNDS